MIFYIFGVSFLAFRQDFSEILGIQDRTTFHDVPSYAYISNKFYGTGSLFLVYNNGAISESYTVIVQGDVNGDSIVDALDLYGIEKAINGHSQLEGCYGVAADIDRNNELAMEDYTQAVNLALAG